MRSPPWQKPPAGPAFSQGKPLPTGSGRQKPAVIVVDLLEVVDVNQADEEVSALRLLDCFLRKVHEDRPEYHPAQVVKISLDPELALVLLVLVKKQERGDPLSLHDIVQGQSHQGEGQAVKAVQLPHDWPLEVVRAKAEDQAAWPGKRPRLSKTCPSIRPQLKRRRPDRLWRGGQSAPGRPGSQPG